MMIEMTVPYHSTNCSQDKYYIITPVTVLPDETCEWKIFEECKGIGGAKTAEDLSEYLQEVKDKYPKQEFRIARIKCSCNEIIRNWRKESEHDQNKL